MSAHNADYVLALTPEEARFVRLVGRHLRKQEGWWDDSEWSECWHVVDRLEHWPDPTHNDGYGAGEQP